MIERVPNGHESEIRGCALCGGQFMASRPSQTFCGRKCRKTFFEEIGASGIVAAVRKIKGGASVVIHLSGPAAQSALGLELKGNVRLVPVDQGSKVRF